MNHPHILKLITAFYHNGKHYIITPKADDNLYSLFENRNCLDDMNYLSWILQQLSGLANALEIIHEDPNSI